MSPADREKYRPRSPLELEGENKRIKNEKLTHVSFINFIFIFFSGIFHIFFLLFIFGVVIFVLCPKLLNSGGNLLPYFFFFCLSFLFFYLFYYCHIFFLFLYIFIFTVRIISTNCDRFYYESWELEWKKVLMGFALSK